MVQKTYHVCMAHTVHARYVPYAYGMKYAHGTQHIYYHSRVMHVFCLPLKIFGWFCYYGVIEYNLMLS